MQSSQDAAMHKINYQLIVLHCVLMQRPLNAAEKEHGALAPPEGSPSKTTGSAEGNVGLQKSPKQMKTLQCLVSSKCTK